MKFLAVFIRLDLEYATEFITILTMKKKRFFRTVYIFIIYAICIFLKVMHSSKSEAGSLIML